MENVRGSLQLSEPVSLDVPIRHGTKIASQVGTHFDTLPHTAKEGATAPSGAVIPLLTLFPLRGSSQGPTSAHTGRLVGGGIRRPALTGAAAAEYNPDGE